MLHRFRLPLLSLVGVLLAALALSASLHPATAASKHVDIVTFNREVDPASAQFLSDAIDTAQHDGATALVIQIDTPGGDVDAMKSIVERELASTVPLITYVTPSGGFAASAGAFIALAAPVVAMAPNTEIGASAPVDSSGGNLDSTLDAKLRNTLSAQIQQEQTTFHRNAPAAADMVMKAASYPADAAVAQHIVDYQENTLDDLLAAVDGKTVTPTTGPSFTYATKGLPHQQLEPTFANTMQALLYDPNILFLLFMIAAVCIYLELSHPGAVVPGTIGAIALVLFLVSARSLQPNWAGLVLMLLAIVLLAIDVRAPTHGILTAGALISLVVGAIIFFDTGTNRAGPTLNLYVLTVMVAVVAAISALVIRAVIRTRKWPVKTGREGLIGETARVIEPLAPEGRVRVLGENWAARLAEPFSHSGQEIETGQEVRIVKVDGLTLIVEPQFALGDIGGGMLTWTR